MFSNCMKLESINLNNFKTDNLNDISFLFSYCESLSSVDLSNFNTKKSN